MRWRSPAAALFEVKCVQAVLHTATHCNALQHTAAHCNTLQHTATCCNTLQRTCVQEVISWIHVQRPCTPVTHEKLFKFKDMLWIEDSLSMFWFEECLSTCELKTLWRVSFNRLCLRTNLSLFLSFNNLSLFLSFNRLCWPTSLSLSRSETQSISLTPPHSHHPHSRCARHSERFTVHVPDCVRYKMRVVCVTMCAIHNVVLCVWQCVRYTMRVVCVTMCAIHNVSHMCAIHNVCVSQCAIHNAIHNVCDTQCVRHTMYAWENVCVCVCCGSCVCFVSTRRARPCLPPPWTDLDWKVRKGSTDADRTRDEGLVCRREVCVSCYDGTRLSCRRCCWWVAM